MFKPINVYRVGNYFHSVEETLPSLKDEVKAACGKHIRRIDRFTQLALIGASQCTKDLQLERNTGLYLSSIYGSLNNSLDVLSSMFKGEEVPSPLKFVNTVSNAACFHLAEQLGLQANNQFLARDDFALEGALKFAEMDLHLGRIEAALVGVVCEVGLPIETHRKRFSSASSAVLGEASHWLFLANHFPGQTPLASLQWVAEPLSDGILFKKLDCVIDSNKPLDVIYAKQVAKKDKENIESQYGLNRCSYLVGKPSYEFTTALSVCEWLTTAPAGRQLIHLDKNANGQWSVLVFEK